MKTTEPNSSPGVWQRRIVAPLLGQLTQGTSPAKLALTLGIGSVCSLFPFLGFTTALNLAVGVRLRLNQAILQALNYALSPVHLVMIVVYVHLGERLWRAPADSRFSVTEMLHVFHEADFGTFFRQFGQAGLYALSAWVLSAPLIFALIYFSTRPLLQRLALRRRTVATP